MSRKNSTPETTAPTPALSDEQHPDYQAYVYGDDEDDSVAEAGDLGPDGPGLPGIPPLNPIPDLPIPNIPGIPLKICSAVSGRYKLKTVLPPIGGPGIPILNLTTVTVRVDVDRFYPQKRISIEVTRLLPRSMAHLIANVTSDKCTGLNRRKIQATIAYREGNNALIPGEKLLFEASRGLGVGYSTYKLTVTGTGTPTRVYNLDFVSQYFDDVEFEVDKVDNAGNPSTDYSTHSHPNRPASLPNEVLSLENVYKRAGFNATISPNSAPIPATGAGANGTWSDSEMHNAMQTYWSRFANKPQWVLWVLFANQHDTGYGLGGVMFDDIGPNHRQGTAIFTNSFIQDAPAGDANPVAWRQRMLFWTAIHEMGHAFNLAHSWQKALSGPGYNPWIPLLNQPEARSFMNYPYNVSGGQSSFFSNFDFRFTNEELQFMRHAPRRFVQMGNENWFSNHGFEAPQPELFTGRYKLEVRPNRENNTYSFLEPVSIELKLTNTSTEPLALDEHLLQDGGHIVLFVQKDSGTVRKWEPLIVRCHQEHKSMLAPGESIYGTHLVSASTSGWLIDEPGFYNIQAGVDMLDEVVMSNVLRVFVAPSTDTEENKIAPDYFTEDVSRALVFDGAPELGKAMDTLKEVADKLPGTPASFHAAKAVAGPMLKQYKRLEEKDGSLAVVAGKADVDEAVRLQTAALLDEPQKAADTFGHIDYFQSLETLADVLNESGKKAEAKKVMSSSISTMKSRNVLDEVIQQAEAKAKNL
ncbi:MAG: hypothetical protein BGO21_02575 [Dyadobacter sp. 50-39]|uniref:hypothetical protein n=1 Tax=Dyadobacter sp. 50-39 TaxID=1895756 RepID=UPI000959AEE9|nr:hypothetical protein [Dyadobacter sp. 50-39]OJV12649.1 MAG: hypothetical protein BGO21_02575 [Dyadobacter sp. 50-39]